MMGIRSRGFGAESAGMMHASWRRMAVVGVLLAVAAVVVPACAGEAPANVVSLTYLDEQPAALQERFDASPGVPRVVLLLSPA